MEERFPVDKQRIICVIPANSGNVKLLECASRQHYHFVEFDKLLFCENHINFLLDFGFTMIYIFQNFHLFFQQ